MYAMQAAYLRQTSAATDPPPIADTGSADIPDRMVLQYLDLVRGHEALAWRSWAVHKSWGEAQYAPRVVSKAQCVHHL